MRTFVVIVILLAVLVLDANRSSSDGKFPGYDKTLKILEDLMGNLSFISDIKDESRMSKKFIKSLVSTKQRIETRELPDMNISHKILLERFCNIPKYKELCEAGDELDYVARVVDAEYEKAPRYKPEFAGESSWFWDTDDLVSYDDDDVERLETKYKKVLHDLYDYPEVYEMPYFAYGADFALCTWDPK